MIGLFLSLAGPACTSMSEIELASTRAPVRAELIQKVYRTSPCITLWRGGTCSYQETAIVLHNGPFSRELPYGCLSGPGGRPEADLVVESGPAQPSRLAFRCAKKARWQVVYLGSKTGSKTGSFLDCNQHAAETPDWNRIPSFATAAPGMVKARCPIPFESIAAEIKDTQGDTGVRQLLTATLQSPTGIRSSSNGLQAWDGVWADLPSAEKAKMQSTFRDTILGDSSLTALERSLRYADSVDASLTAAATRRMQHIVQAPPGAETDQVSNLILRHLARAAPADASSLGCAELDREVKRGALLPLDAAVVAILSDQNACPATLFFLQRAGCDAAFFCAPGRLCEAAELSGTVASALTGRPGELPPAVQRDRLLLAASLRHPDAGRILQLWQDRRSYTIEQSDTPSCESLYLEGTHNTPCRCTTSVPPAACGTDRVHAPYCSFQVDDARRRIFDVRSL